MTKVLVTGGSGRIGRRLVKRLLEAGDEVTVIDPKHGNIEGVKYITAPITEISKLDNVDVVYHLAARIDYKATRDELWKSNVVPTIQLLSLCKTCKQFILMSTTSVYNESKEPITESSPTDPYTNYGWSKNESERVVKGSGIPYTVIRSSQVYGPEFEEGYVKFLKALKEGKLRILGSGDNYIPLVHINDLIDALVLVKNNNKALDKVFNVDGGYRKTQIEFMSMAATLLNVDPPAARINAFVLKIMRKLANNRAVIEYSDKLVKNRLISIEKIRNLGYEPKVDLKRGMSEVIQEFKARGLL